MDFILIHIGDSIPNHALSNLDSLVDFGFDVHFVCSEKNTNQIKNSVKHTTIESLGLESCEYKVKKTGNKNHDDFLTKTSLRFLILSEYVKNNNLKNFFHVENDVFLLDKNCIEKTSKFLLKSDFDISLVMDSESRCVPSIVWFRNPKTCSDLWNFMSKENTKTDMELLSDYYHKNKDFVINFPIAPVGYIKELTKVDYSSFFDEVNCVFDGAAIGQYLYGTDDGNGGENSKGFVNETSVLKPSDLFFEKKQDQLVSSFDNKEFCIANIHMHCKRKYSY